MGRKPKTAKTDDPFGKETKTINFDRIVLKKLIEKANRENSTVSNLVNHLCRSVIVGDVNFYAEMSKMHYLKFQEYQFLKNQAENHNLIRVDVK